MKILFDTNIILDVLLLRKPFYTSATFLLSQVEQGKIEGWLCPTTITTLGYLITKVKGPKEAKRLIKNLLNIFKLTDLNRSIFLTACNHKINDYEDAVLHESARLSNMEGIVTRNVKDFKHASVYVYDPDELMGMIKSS
ncbi:PIN domain-containing protein [Fidelibacter multiformis]|uniref:PIN domain-containing protein n=1 Tax=Fidelibacter multiformis TaxID=3377529 RepID=UPI0037DC6D86